MSDNFLSSVQCADSSTHWLSAEKDINGESKLIQTEKTALNTFGWKVVYIITFGIYDREKVGFKEVAQRIGDVFGSTTKSNNYLNKQQLSTLRQVITAIKALNNMAQDTTIMNAYKKTFKEVNESIREHSAEALYNSKEDPNEVINKFLELKKENSTQAKSFILDTDDKGDTFFHHYIGMRGNLQKPAIIDVQKALGPELFKQCLLTPNLCGQTPLGIAMGNFQIGVTSVALLILNDAEKSSIRNEVASTTYLLERFI